MEAQAAFGDHIHIFIAADDEYLISDIDCGMGRYPVWQFPQFRYLAR